MKLVGWFTIKHPTSGDDARVWAHGFARVMESEQERIARIIAREIRKSNGNGTNPDEE